MKFEKINQFNRNYLSDESRLEGDADFIVFCENISDIKDAVKEAASRGFGITLQGARTGITGGAVPVKDPGAAGDVPADDAALQDGGAVPVTGAGGLSKVGGAVLNLSKMKQVYSIREDEKGYRIKSGPGLSLSEIEGVLKGGAFDISFLDDESKQNLDIIKRDRYFFPPDPTEKSASIGGIAANCASGSRSFYYGSARNFISSLDIVLADSTLFHIKRGRHSEAAASWPGTEDLKKQLKEHHSTFNIPDCKNAAGLYAEKDMDLIDLFIGSEGILGIIASLEFIVIKEPLFISGLLIFPPDISTNLNLAEYFRDNSFNSCITAAVEYFDRNALTLLRSFIDKGLFKTLFPFSANSTGGALYVEIHSDNTDEGLTLLETIALKLKEFAVEDNCVYVSDGEADLQRMKDFRHSVPESVNMSIDIIRKKGEDVTKLGTDLAVPDKSFRELFDIYYRDLEKSGLKSAVFGHIGDNHLHVNIIPENLGEYDTGKLLVRKWAEAAVSMGGTVSAEHGTGRLKKEYLELMYGKEGIEKIAYIKSLFDPGLVLNIGVMI